MASPDSIQELLDKMAGQRDALLAEAEAVDDARASVQSPDAQGEGQWSVKQQLAHLAEMETAYRAWVQRALEEDGADVSRVRGEAPEIPLTDAQSNTVSALTAQLRAQRARTIALIQSLTPEQFERTASQPMFGALTVMQWLRSYYRHDRMHRDQIAGREPEYKPKFVGGNEPDQRRGERVGG